MIVEYVRYRIPTSDADDFEQAYARAAASLDRSPQCLDYELARCVEEPELFTLRITWESIDAHLQGFRGGPEFRSFFAEVRTYVEHLEEMQHYEVTDVHSAPR